MPELRTRRNQIQQGAISIELALAAPIAVLLIIGGVHLGLVLSTRHALADASGYAARRAALAGTTDVAAISALVTERLGNEARCNTVAVDATRDVDSLGLESLRVTVRCALDTGLGGALLAGVGPAELVVTAAMPLSGGTP